MTAKEFLKEKGWKSTMIKDDEKGQFSIDLALLMDEFKENELKNFMEWYYSNVHLKNYKSKYLIEMYLNGENEY